MTLLDIASLLIVLAAVFSFINHRYLKFPTAIGLMLISLLMSLTLIGLGKLGFDIEHYARDLFARIDFNEALMHGMLSFLLFAGALHVNINDLARQKWIIGTLASVGVIASALIVAILIWGVTSLIGLPLPLIYCLLFGALIAPTDPVAVVGILKTAKVPKSLETKITGESLFNDGVAVVLFIVMLRIAAGGQVIGPAAVVGLFLLEAVGGVLFGLAIGWVSYRMLKQVNNYQVEVLITVALVMGGYALADALHLSGPIAIVVAGLLIGNHGRMLAMSTTTRAHLDHFWELIDEVLNAVLFVLIGLEVLVLVFTRQYFLAGMIAIPIVLLARFVSVGFPIGLMRRRRPFSPHAVKILTWGGLRGGISVALALSLPAAAERDALVAMTYLVVVFSILVQGLTVGRFIRRVMAGSKKL
jgi:monovalent cation:H+ antiporter, CPA1 family